MTAKNSVTDFIRAGKSLLSEEGVQMLNNAKDVDIQAAMQDPQILKELTETFNSTNDVYLRRKLMKVFAGD